MENWYQKKFRELIEECLLSLEEQGNVVNLLNIDKDIIAMFDRDNYDFTFIKEYWDNDLEYIYIEGLFKCYCSSIE